LIAHFQDGLEKGAPPEGLIKTFGDPAVAARLIRRSKKRNRPIWYRAAARTFQGSAALFGLLVLVYAASAARVYFSSPQIRRNFAAEYNAPILAVPEQDRAWPLYRQGALSIGQWPEFVQFEHSTPGCKGWESLVLQR
jgi:hypothetical protein